ncbi:hypothetical protein PUN28_011517 [Cardiocondyla obscurior]|uniref:Uncharacterized protein n=1 Tax=Cardiocondyla obscurior TaxID=286306 RepID=A0AAW2FIS9_9HYME
MASISRVSCEWSSPPTDIYTSASRRNLFIAHSSARSARDQPQLSSATRIARICGADVPPESRNRRRQAPPFNSYTLLERIISSGRYRRDVRRVFM